MKKFLTIAILLSFTAISCELMAPLLERGRLNLSIGTGINSRTVLPSINSGMIDLIFMEFDSGPVEKEPIQVSPEEETVIIPLLAGDWTVTVRGMKLDADNDPIEIARGNLSFTINPMRQTNEIVTLRTLESADGTGFMNITLDWSATSSGIKDAIRNVRARFGTIEEPQDISSELSTDLAAFTSRIIRGAQPSGNYLIQFFLEDGSMPPVALTAASEAVQIRDNLESSKTIALTDEDFNLSGLNLTINLETPQDLDIQFNVEQDHVFTAGNNVVISVQSGWDSYRWSLDGDFVAEATADQIDLGLQAEGVHHLTVYIGHNGNLYSDTLRFHVGN